MAPEKLQLSKSYFKNHPCWQVLKDYIPADSVNASELSPVVRYDPQLQNQFARYGYAIMQIGDQLRTVYAGTNKLDRAGVSDNLLTCPVCQQRFTRADFEEHTRGKLIDPNALQNQTVPYSGNMNPPATVGMEPGQDLRTGMSSWANQELARSFYGARSGTKMSLEKRAEMALEKRTHKTPLQKSLHGGNEATLEFVYSQPKVLQKDGQVGEHEVPEDMILRLPLPDRIFFEVWAYNQEYGAASTADVSCELETRGKDQDWQTKTEAYAHANDSWLPQALEALAAQGLIKRDEAGSWIVLVTPAIDQGVSKAYNPDQPRGEHGQWTSTGSTQEHAIQIAPGIEGNQKIRVSAPGKDDVEGTARYATSAGVFYATDDGKMHIALRDWVKTQNAQGEWAKPEGLSSPKAPTVPKTPEPTEAPKPPGEGWIKNPVTGGWDRPHVDTPKKPVEGIDILSPEFRQGIQSHSVPLGTAERDSSPWKIAKFEEQKSGEHTIQVSPIPGVKIPYTLHYVPVTKDDVNNAFAKFSPEETRGVQIIVGDMNTGKLQREDIPRVNQEFPDNPTKPVSSSLVTSFNRGGMVTVTYVKQGRGIFYGHSQGIRSQIYVGNQNEEFHKDMGTTNEEAIAHEIGHHIYACELTDQERNTFNVIYDRSSFRDGVSKYAGNSREEGFAEAMRMYKYHPDTLKEKMPHVYTLLSRYDRSKSQ